MRHKKQCGVMVLLAGSVMVGVGPPSARTPEISHLPVAVQDEILEWRSRLESAACLKVVADLDETWERMDQLDERGDPVVVRRERFQCHAWMTPDMLWLVIFAYDGEHVDTATPRTQILWERESRLVRERYWDEQENVYRMVRYMEERPWGPENAHLVTKGCNYGSLMESWLVGGPGLEDRCLSFQSYALMRTPNLAIVPPDHTESGVWLDVFRVGYERDTQVEGDKLYRRQDFALLSRDENGEPVVSERRTIVMTDQKDGGARPTQIYGTKHLAYEFYQEAPEQLTTSVSAFARDIDAIASPLGLADVPTTTGD
ncbi:MAG: hypothetical protein R3B57_13435 [Phycisphaerales bacterium]